jgi:hypothetical protein
MANYLDRKELLAELLKSKEDNELTERAFQLLHKMVKECSKVMRYKNPMDKEDCMQSAILDCLLYWRNFDPDHPRSNVFAFFTQYIKNGHGKGFNQLYPENKKNIQLIPISEEGGVYNI